MLGKLMPSESFTNRLMLSWPLFFTGCRFRVTWIGNDWDVPVFDPLRRAGSSMTLRPSGETSFVGLEDSKPAFTS
jgi:hypothetical protein